jgi:hypothetical protein
MIQVIPLNDIFHHDTDSETETPVTCDCNPSVERYAIEIVIIHNAFDGREIFEALDNMTLEKE